MSVCLCEFMPCIYVCLWRPEEDIKYPRAGVTGSFETSDMGGVEGVKKE